MRALVFYVQTDGRTSFLFTTNIYVGNPANVGINNYVCQMMVAKWYGTKIGLHNFHLERPNDDITSVPAFTTYTAGFRHVSYNKIYLDISECHSLPSTSPVVMYYVLL